MKNLSLFIIIISYTFCFSQDIKDSDRFGKEGEQRIIELTKKSESIINIEDGKKIRREILDWWIKNPNITLNWCADVLAKGKNKRINPIVSTQAIFGAGVYLIENPDERDNDIEFYLAGVRSALRLYQNAIHESNKNKDKFFSKLLKMDQDGNLIEWIKDAVEECRKDEEKKLKG